MLKKVTVIGAGNVGATCAKRILEKGLADVVLVDIDEGVAAGKALDLMQSASVEGFLTSIKGASSYDDTEDSAVTVITAGIPRKPGMSRDELLSTNAGIVSGIVRKIIKGSPETIFIIVTNPLDVMTYLTLKVSGFSANKVLGMAGVLDSARYRYFLSQSLEVSPAEIQAMVLGGHGDSMVPLPRYSTVSGVPVTELLDGKTIESINQRTRTGGAEIVGLLKTGSAYYAPSSSAVSMVENILTNRKAIVPASVFLSGEYGYDDICLGVPVMISSNGVERIVELDLDKDESSKLEASASIIKANIKKLYEFGHI